MLGGKEDRKEYAAYYEQMIGVLNQANSIVTEFLSLARDKPLKPELQNLNETVRSLSPLLHSDSVVHRINIILDLVDVPDLLLDGREIRSSS